MLKFIKVFIATFKLVWSGSLDGKAVPYFRMNPDEYKLIEASATSGLNVVPKTELEAGYKIGAERVLGLLRDKIVVLPQG